MSKRAKSALVGAVSAVALATTVLIKPWEGVETKAYQDIVGVWTICYGETKGVRPGMRATATQCDDMLKKRLSNDYAKPLAKCIDGFDQKPVSWQASAISLSYNVGVSAVCRSSAARLARVGLLKDSCEAMTKFNRAGGRVVQGLKNRRENGDAGRIGEYELCIAGL